MPGDKDESRGRILTVVRGIALVVLVIAGSWTFAYWIASLRWPAVPVGSAGFFAQLGLFIFILVLWTSVASAAGRRSGQRSRDYFLELGDAMRRIARGDFSVRLEAQGGRENPFGGVADDLNEMAESLKRIEAMRQEFVSDVSHEIQSPLTSIAGFARVLRDESIGPKQRLRYLDIIEAESKRLSRLSDNLLKLTSLDSRAQPLSPAAYELDAQLRSVVLAAEPQWTLKRIEVSADLDGVTVTADEASLSQVWSNIIHNAIKFTPENGRIAVELRERNGRAVVKITDSGTGIAPEDKSRVFERFYVADKSRTRSDNGSGSGLGLAIAAKIVALHGGAISVESDGPGTGSTFVVELPIDGTQAP